MDHSSLLQSLSRRKMNSGEPLMSKSILASWFLLGTVILSQSLLGVSLMGGNFEALVVPVPLRTSVSAGNHSPAARVPCGTATRELSLFIAGVMASLS